MSFINSEGYNKIMKIRAFKRHLLHLGSVLTLVILGLAFQGCQTLKEIANLRNVDFALGQLNNINLAGVNLDNVRSYSDVKARDVLKLTAAFAKRELPLSFTLNVKAENPADNSVAARLTRMDWSLFLEDREAISGSLDQEYLLNPGEPVAIPVAVDFDLLEAFGGNIRDLIQMALSLKDGNGPSKDVKVVATPFINTAIGPIKYPQPITIINETAGG